METVHALLARLPERLGDIPRRWAATAADAPAVREGAQTWSYRDLAETVGEAAAWLDALGVRPGDRVMLVGENCAALVALILAAGDLDAWAVIINARLSAREIDVIREHCGARRVIYTVAVSDDAVAHAKRHGADIVPAGRLGRLAVGSLNGDCAPEPVQASGAEQVAVLIYTSGTTGHPKAVMLTHRNLMFIAAVSGGLRGLTPSDRVYGVLPVSHVYGLASVTLGTLWAGACLQPVPRFFPDQVLDALADDGITALQGVPAMYARLLELLKAGRRLQAPRLRFTYAGGSPLDPTLKAEVEAYFGMPLHNGYGLTESAPTISQTRLDAPRSDTSVGPALPGLELRIVDADGRDVPQGTPGELWVRGPNVMKGYYREPEMTAQAIGPGGWLNTGDLARREADGALFIVGRTKDLIIRSGFNVYPIEVEGVLNTHPAVSQSAVVGRPAEEGNEEVVAFVEVVPGRQVSPEELQAHAANALSPYKRPSRIVLLPALPAAATGKVLKSRLKEMAREL